MKRVKLTANFYLDEFTRSQVAARRGITIDVPEGSDVMANLQRLCAEILQPLRDQICEPIHIDSGYRPPHVNKLVGGAPDSQHCVGEAADIVSFGPYAEPLALAKEIVRMRLPFDQLIHEFGRWVHVSVPAAGDGPRRIVLTSVQNAAGGAHYMPGLREV